MASEGEMIEVVELSIEDVISYINSEDCQSPVFTVSINLQFTCHFPRFILIKVKDLIIEKPKDHDEFSRYEVLVF